MYLCGRFHGTVNIHKPQVGWIYQFFDLDRGPVAAGELGVGVLHWRVVNEFLDGELRNGRLSLRSWRGRVAS